ncbi:ABC transporter permease subunit [Paenibacillus physcomitrellae]|uniref:ABC transporter permease n=1 Tax=Paenibacillus physcomitrellae TaxID=1619311 RepID=A0ABQ1GT46_9BACL|nr:ABC transporter permease subunit [Paenibacillus physcomitrellae]GGA49433.1 ABC transporter permease [Paenibacillus physcomitrellae]
MNGVLYKRMLGIKLKGLLQYAIGAAFYMLLMLGVYPSIAGNNSAVDEVIRSLPEGVSRAFGLGSGFGSVDAFISGEFYGLIMLVLLGVFTVQLSGTLMSRLIDQGSMAYLLSAPTTRGKIAWAQALVLVTGLLLVVGVTTLAGFAGYDWLIGGRYSFDGTAFVWMNVQAFLLFFALGGLSFLISSLSNEEKRAKGISGTVVFLFYTFDLLAKLSESLDWMKWLTPFSLYRPSDIVAGGGHLLLSGVVLFALGVLCYAAAVMSFTRRDLPL